MIKEINPDLLVDLGVIKNADKDSVKILGNRRFTKAYTCQAHKFSKSAVE